MREKILEFLRIPPEIQPEYWQQALSHNRLSLVVINIMILGMELFNMARVLLWSASGLGTLNNRIYFTMYCSLFLAAVLSLLLEYSLRRASRTSRWMAQYGAVLFFLLWHVCLNAYDMRRDSTSEIGIYITAVLALAVFIQMPGRYSLAAYTLAYLLFTALTGPTLEVGDRINLTFTTVVALAVSLTSCRHSTMFIAQRREISQMNLQLQDLARKDSLTGLLNTAAFQGQVELSLSRMEHGKELDLLIVDMDDFKGINDRFGHPCGDYVLKAAALRLQSVFSHAAGIGRIGGDEFAVVLTGPGDDGELRALGEQLIREVASIRWQGRGVGACCSVGICRASRPGADYAALYREADRAMYTAKEQGKGRCCLCRLA